MMSVLEYAMDVDKSVDEILKRCKSLNINVENEDDELDEEAITELDSVISSELEEAEETYESEYAEIEEETLEEEIQEKQKKQAKAAVGGPTQTKVKTTKKDLARKKKEMYKSKEKLISNAPVADTSILIYKDGMTIGELAKEISVPASELIKKLFALGILATVNSSIDFEKAALLAMEYNKELKTEQLTDETKFEDFEINDSEENLVKRPPVVTIMGHVDHGKTSLLDAIRKSDVVSGEAGGITQAISAYQLKHNDERITFIDTPGHAAFTEMRSRGAQITDIVIIIVAADDGVMPQTKEAIDHAKAAEVPIIVAINKIDKPGINIERVMSELSEYGLTPDSWGGDTIYVQVSAKTGAGIDNLLENIVLVAEMEDYKANPNRYALGTVIESRLDKQVGSVVTVLVQNGTLRLGDPIVVGSSYGKIRTLKNDKGEEVTTTKLSQPVEITGLSETPKAGDKFMAFETEKQARAIGEARKSEEREHQTKSSTVSLEEIFAKIQDGTKEINVIIKADVNGSAEAVKNALEKIEVDGAGVRVVRSGVGAITESDIVLANASGAVVIGFNIRPNNIVRDYASEQMVEIRMYDIIYKAVEEMEAAMKGMLDPIFEEKTTGSAEVRQLFKFSKVGVIAGSYVTEGVVKTSSKVRVIRDGTVIFDGEVNTVQREKDIVKEVKKGFECGITVTNFSDIKVGDVIEAYEIVEKAR